MKWHSIVLLFIIFPAIILEIILLWWWIYPYKPLVILEPPKILNKNNQVKNGELLIYSMKFDKRTLVKPIITRKLINGVEYTISEYTPANPIGENTKTFGFVFPKELSEDVWTLKTEACYKMNPIRQPICVTYYSNKFTNKE